MLFFETSAKTAEHVSESFSGITSELIKTLESSTKKKQTLSHGVSLGDRSNKAPTQGCCYWSGIKLFCLKVVKKYMYKNHNFDKWVRILHNFILSIRFFTMFWIISIVRSGWGKVIEDSTWRSIRFGLALRRKWRSIRRCLRWGRSMRYWSTRCTSLMRWISTCAGTHKKGPSWPSASPIGCVSSRAFLTPMLCQC